MAGADGVCAVGAVAPCPICPICIACCGVMAAPDSMKLRMSFLVTRPLIPVPSRREMSMPCSRAILRTSGLDFVRRNSSAVCSRSLAADADVEACGCPVAGCAVGFSSGFACCAEGGGGPATGDCGADAACAGGCSVAGEGGGGGSDCTAACEAGADSSAALAPPLDEDA